MDAPQVEPPHEPARKGRLVLIGGAIALVAGAAIAGLVLNKGSGDKAAAPASQGGLVIETRPVENQIDPARPLRCFVQGRFAGEFTLAECAQRNGVATDALDVGVDATGALAATQDAGLVLTPLPPEESLPEEGPPLAGPGPVEMAPQPQGACWRHAAGQWRRLPADMQLAACAQALFAGRCERPGQASYGRWGQQTLRLVTGRIEISSDNQSFRTLAQQGPGCSVPPLG